MAVNWVMDTRTMFSACRGASRRRLYLQVEALVGGDGWDWAVWVAGDAGTGVHGVASTAEAAMAEAERAASRVFPILSAWAVADQEMA